VGVARSADLLAFRFPPRGVIMSKHLERDLEVLERDLLSLAGNVQGAIDKAIRALRESDAGLAREVIAGDGQIDFGENQLDEECLKILALHQPVAVDLRRVISVIQITTDLERMGDLAEEIAERALTLAGLPRFPIPEKLQHMADLTMSMVQQSLDAFVELDTEQARAVLRLDDEVDRYNAEIIAEILQAMKDDPALIDAGMSLFSATRHLERIADHATNIAEGVVYLAEGEVVRHKAEATDVSQAGNRSASVEG
jgi:phosphate transport system protein